MDAHTLAIKIAADISDLVSKMGLARQAVTSTMGAIGSQIERIKGLAMGMAGAFAAGLTVTAFAAILQGSIAAAAGLNDLSLQTGATVEGLSALASAGKYSDMTAEGIAQAMNKLTKNLTSATEESAGTGKAIQLLGLNMGNFLALRPDEQMLEIAKALDQFQDGAGKSAVMMALYGKEGANMLPFMKDLAAVGELQAKVTAEQAAAADNYDDNLKKITSSSDAWKKELVVGMIPALDRAAESYLSVINGAGGFRDQIRQLTQDGSITEWTETGITFITYLADVFQAAIGVVKQAGQSVAVVINDIITGVRLAGTAIGSGFTAEGREAMSKILDERAAFLAAAGEDFDKNLFPELVGEKFRAKMAELKNAKVQSLQDYNAAVQVVMQAYANSSVEIQRKAMQSLKEAYFGADKQQLNANGLGRANVAAKESSEYEKLIQSISEKLAVQKAEFNGVKQLTEVEKEAVVIKERIEKGYLKLTPLQRANLDALLEERDGIDKLNEAKKEAMKVAQERVKLLQKESEGIEQHMEMVRQAASAVIKAQEDRITSLSDEIAANDLAYEKNISLAQAIELVAIARLREKQANSFFEGGEGWNNIDEEITRRQRLLSLMNTRDLREKERSGWASVFQSIDGAAHDVWTAMWAKGSNVLQRLAQLIKTGILDVLYQAFGRKLIIEVGTVFLGSGFQQAAQAAVASQATNVLTNGLSLSSLGSSLTNAITSLGTVAGQFMTGVQSFFGLGAAGSSTIAANAALGVELGLGSSAATAAATAAGQAAGSSFMASVGAAAVPVAIAAVVANALGLFRKTTQVGAGLSGTLGEGDISTYALMRKSGTLFQGPDYTLQNKGIAEQSAALQTAYQTMRAATAGMATQLGLSADAVVNFTTRLGNDLLHPDTGGYGLKLDGLSQEQIQAKVSEALASANDALAQQILGTWTTATETVTRVITDEAGHWDSGVESITREITETIEKTAYQASEFAKQGETASQTLARLSGDLGVVNAAFDTLGATLLKGLKGADQASSLVSAFGGQDAFKTATAAYYEAFYSEEEKRATLTRQVTEALAAQNLVLPTSVEAYRALVEAQDLTTASGQAAAAVLVKLGPTFLQTFADIEAGAKDTAAQVSQYLGPVNDAATQSNETLIKLLDERKSLEADLATAMGGTAAAIALATEGMDEQGKAAWAVNQILKQQIAAQEQINTARDNILSLQRDLMQAQFGDAAVAAFDLAQATKDMTADQRISYVQQVAIASAIQRAITVEGQKKSLQEELLSLTETSAEALVRQRAALDESVRGLFDQVQAIRAAKAAEEERKGLTEQYLRATSQTAALRALELAKLDPTNRALQAQIWAYDDLKTAQEKAVAAAERAIAAEQKRQDEIVTGAEKLVDSLGSVFELLNDQVRELYGQTDATKAMLATQGMALIDKAIATGVLPTQKDLTQAITAARAGLDANSFASKAEYTYAQLTLAGKLSLLRSDAQEQLTTAEQALAVAKQQQETLDAQLDALKGVETGVLSVAQAIAAAVAANAALAAASGSSGATSTASLGAWTGQGGAMWNDTWARAAGDSTLYSADEFRALIAAKVMTAQGAAEVNAGRIEAGMSLEDFDRYMRYAAGTSAAALASLGLPAFENGGMHSGGLRLVGERGWEVEATGPARYWNQQQLGQAMSGVNTERLETLVADMSVEIASLRAELSAIKTNTRQTTDILDRTSEGSAAFRTRAIA